MTLPFKFFQRLNHHNELFYKVKLFICFRRISHNTLLIQEKDSRNGNTFSTLTSPTKERLVNSKERLITSPTEENKPASTSGIYSQLRALIQRTDATTADTDQASFVILYSNNVADPDPSTEGSGSKYGRIRRCFAKLEFVLHF
jgi:hypothetical protein